MEHDLSRNNNYQLSDAARKIVDKDIDELELVEMPVPPQGWNIDLWFKICSKPYHERLIIAGSMIAAELDRLQEINPKLF